MTIEVFEDDDGAVRFVFFDAPVLHGGRLIPIGTNYLPVYRKGQERYPPLWHIVLNDGALVGEVAYGILPFGFRQHLPGVGKPPALKRGFEYCVESHGSACFRYRGQPERADCDSGRSLRHVIGPRDAAERLRAMAEATGNPPFFAQGSFDEEELGYLGRTAAPNSFDLVLMTTTWGEGCRATRRLLIFAESGRYLGCYTGLSEPPTHLFGNTLFFPVRSELGDRIEFNGPQPPPALWLDGFRVLFEPVASRQP